MFKALFGAAAVLASVSLAQNANAAVIVVLQDNFDTESLGLNHTTFANWTVTAGAVDVLGAPNFFNLLPGNGRYVDLDGTTHGGPPAGELTSKAVFGPWKYTLSFELAGNQRIAASKTSTVTLGIGLGGFSQSITLAEFAPFTTETFTFVTTTAGHLVFSEGGKADFRGNLLDDVVLTAVPEMSTWAMMLAGFALVGLQLRRSATKRFDATA